MNKLTTVIAVTVLGILATLIDSISYTLSVLSDGVFIGLIIAVVCFAWPDGKQE